MSDKYRNENGVYIDVHTDSRGREHIDIYDRDLSDSDHSSIHINWDSRYKNSNKKEKTKVLYRKWQHLLPRC